MKIKSFLKFSLLFSLCLILLNACSSAKSPKLSSPSSAEYDSQNLVPSADSSDSKTNPAFIPWQTWQNGLTSKQIGFKDSRIRAADQLLEKQDFLGALALYKTANASGIDESESLAIRISSAELLSGDAPRAVTSLSRHFQNRKQQESQVSEAATLLFGYAFGQARDFEQALAWFSQALKAQDSLIHTSAKSGVISLLSIIPDRDLDQMDFIWKPDEEISKLISIERSLRQKRPQVRLRSSAFFWSPQDSSLNADKLESNTIVARDQNSRKVVALLPLSGRFARMGEAVKNGLQLAAEISNSRGTKLEVDYKDLSANPDLNNQNENSGPQILDGLDQSAGSVVVGPLISEQAALLAESARRNALPAIILAKAGSATLGGGIYRFGLTNESQASSLISAIMKFRASPRIALVYPQDESGRGFIMAVKESLAEFNLSPIGEYSYSKGNAGQMLDNIAALEASSAEFIIFGDNLKAATQFFNGLSPAFRKSVIPVGSALWDNPIEIMQSKSILSGAIYVSPFYPDLSKPLVAEFVARFKEKNAKTPDFFAAQGYDVGLLLSSSTGGTQSYTPPANLEGISGNMRTRGDGEILRDLAVLRLARGTISPITEIPQSAPASQALLDESSSSNEAEIMPTLKDSAKGSSNDATLGR